MSIGVAAEHDRARARLVINALNHAVYGHGIRMFPVVRTMRDAMGRLHPCNFAAYISVVVATTNLAIKVIEVGLLAREHATQRLAHYTSKVWSDAL
jgi:glycyl-tRNA synthetase (class II)